MVVFWIYAQGDAVVLYVGGYLSFFLCAEYLKCPEAEFVCFLPRFVVFLGGREEGVYQDFLMLTIGQDMYMDHMYPVYCLLL